MDWDIGTVEYADQGFASRENQSTLDVVVAKQRFKGFIKTFRIDNDYIYRYKS